MAKHHFDVPRTIARVNNPKNEPLFRHLGVDEIISPTRMILGSSSRTSRSTSCSTSLRWAWASWRSSRRTCSRARRRSGGWPWISRCPMAARCSASSAPACRRRSRRTRSLPRRQGDRDRAAGLRGAAARAADRDAVPGPDRAAAESVLASRGASGSRVRSQGVGSQVRRVVPSARRGGRSAGAQVPLPWVRAQGFPGQPRAPGPALTQRPQGAVGPPVCWWPARGGSPFPGGSGVTPQATAPPTGPDRGGIPVRVAPIEGTGAGVGAWWAASPRRCAQPPSAAIRARSGRAGPDPARRGRPARDTRRGRGRSPSAGYGRIMDT